MRSRRAAPSLAGCSLEIKESRTELKTKDKEGHFISYNPPRYEYSYNFFAKIDVNSPYFDDINYSISNGYIKVGERPMTGVQSNWRVTSSFVGINNENKYSRSSIFSAGTGTAAERPCHMSLLRRRDNAGRKRML